MGKSIRLKKGFDIKIKGEAQKGIIQHASAATYAIKPTDFIGISPIPKIIPELGSEVKAGDAICYDKANPELVYTAPVSGELVEIKRGAKRRITEIILVADKKQQFKDFGTKDIASLSGEDIRTTLIDSGAWHMLRQRPFNITADPGIVPKGIFISGFQTNPLAPDAEIVMAGQGNNFQIGIDALAKLAPIHLSIDMGHNIPAYSSIENATVHEFYGRHPAGNVGVQIHHISPIGKGEHVWTVNYQDVMTIGRLFLEGKYMPEKVITVAGNGIDNPAYYRVTQGINLENLLSRAQENARIISGDVLSGTAVEKSNFLGFYDNQICVIPEGDEYEFFGWIMPSYPRPTMSKSLVGSFLSKKAFKVNTNMHGERRAFVMSGQYEKVLPMDLFPVQLLKAILANDFEMMEGLGIYEVVEEDLALCEFVCTSKQPVQKILRDGLEYMREQA